MTKTAVEREPKIQNNDNYIELMNPPLSKWAKVGLIASLAMAGSMVLIGYADQGPANCLDDFKPVGLGGVEINVATSADLGGCFDNLVDFPD